MGFLVYSLGIVYGILVLAWPSLMESVYLYLLLLYKSFVNRSRSHLIYVLCPIDI